MSDGISDGIIIDDVLTIVIRDDSPMVYTQDPPKHRTVHIELTPEQKEELRLYRTHSSGSIQHYETIAHCFFEKKGGKQ